MKRREPYLMLILALVLPAALAGCDGGQKVNNPTAATITPTEVEVKADPAVRQDWLVHIPVTGNLRSQSIVEIKAEAGGRLLSAHLGEGEAVRKDQLLGEIDPTNYRLAYDQAMAAVAVSEAGLARIQVMADHARREKERADNLLRSGGITQKDHEAASTGVKEAETEVRLAEAQIRQARAAGAVAEKALRDCRIMSPADGEVQKRHVDPGSLIAPGTPIYTLVDNSRLELECLVPSYRLSELRLGQRAAFTTPTWGERRFSGIVSAINPSIESDNRSIKVLLRMANRGGELRSGMYARGEIEVRMERSVLVIPRSALMVEKEGSNNGAVFVVSQGKARRREVEIGGVQMDRVWVRRGLEPDEAIITEIGPSIKADTPVRPVQAPVQGN